MDTAGPESLVFIYIFPLFLPNKDGSGILQLGRTFENLANAYLLLRKNYKLKICFFPDHVAASPVQEKVTLKKVIDFVKDKGDSDLKEMNRKLQRMLEETLTKNMHLQQVGHMPGHFTDKFHMDLYISTIFMNYASYI